MEKYSTLLPDLAPAQLLPLDLTKRFSWMEGRFRSLQANPHISAIKSNGSAPEDDASLGFLELRSQWVVPGVTVCDELDLRKCTMFGKFSVFGCI